MILMSSSIILHRTKTNIVQITTYLLIGLMLAGCGIQKPYKSLNKKYDQSKYEKVLKKADRYIQKNPADPVPLFFKSMTHTHFYHEEQKAEDLELAMRFLYQARRKNIPSYLKADINRLTHQLLETANQNFSEIEKNNDPLTAQRIHELTNKFEKLPDYKVPKESYTQKTSNEITNQSLPTSGLRKKIVKTSKKYLGIPYKYGGTTTRGFDCSGFTGQVYGDVGINLPRTAALQSAAGKRIRQQKAKPGDLVFFTQNKSGGRINHVAIILETDHKGIKKVIHATSRGVIIDERTGGSWQSYWLPRKKHIASYIED